jgi:PP-loop superfamily ATP-utilizing enzyme
VEPSEVPRLLEEPLATEVAQAIARVGFSSVSVDPRGYRGALAGLTVVP